MFLIVNSNVHLPLISIAPPYQKWRHHCKIVCLGQFQIATVIAMQLEKFVSTGSVAKQDRPGRPRKFDGRGEGTICRVARRLRFFTLKTIVSNVRWSHHYQSASAPLVRKIN